jgi:hypothetical protein
MKDEAKRQAKRELAFELIVNGAFPYLIYEVAVRHYHASDTEGLIWATIVPGLMLIVGVLRQRKLDVVAALTLFTLVVSIAIAVATKDPRLLQLRESYLSAIIGAVMILSAMVGRPALAWLAPMTVPEERRASLRHPLMQRVLGQLTWIWGAVSAGELALKWWMVEHLSIAQVLAFGPIAFAALTALGVLLTLLVAGRARRQALASVAPAAASAGPEVPEARRLEPASPPPEAAPPAPGEASEGPNL